MTPSSCRLSESGSFSICRKRRQSWGFLGLVAGGSSPLGEWVDAEGFELPGDAPLERLVEVEKGLLRADLEGDRVAQRRPALAFTFSQEVVPFDFLATSAASPSSLSSSWRRSSRSSIEMSAASAFPRR